MRHLVESIANCSEMPATASTSSWAAAGAIDPAFCALTIFLGASVVVALEVGIIGFLLRASDVLQVPFSDFFYGDVSPLANGTRFGQAFIALTLGLVVVSALIVASKGPKPKKNGMVGPLAEKSGGDAVKATDPGAAFVEMIQRIRSRYSLYYATPEGQPGTFHALRVELAADARAQNPAAKISARRSYQLSR